MSKTHYIGVDAHSSTCTLTVLNEQGTEMDQITLKTNGRILRDYLRGTGGSKILCFEESDISRWLYEILRPEVQELVVCNPVANNAYKRAKTDRIDSRQLAHLLRGGFLKPVYHDGSRQEKFRLLVSAYQDNLQNLVRMKNQYKALFRRVGIRQNGQRFYQQNDPIHQLEEFPAQFIAQRLFELIGRMQSVVDDYRRQIAETVRTFPESRYLLSIPNIGDIRAGIIIAQVIDPRRFGSKYQFFSYCGLVRHNRTSAGHSYGTTRIWGNRMLKCVFKMAAKASLRGDSAFHHYYDRLREKGVCHKNALNALSRKFAEITLAVWKQQCLFDPARLEIKTASK